MNISITLEVTGYSPGRLPLASKGRSAAPWITLRYNHMHTHPSPPSFRLIPELELTRAACPIG